MRNLILCLLAAALLLAACGDSTDSSTSDPTTTEAAGSDGSDDGGDDTTTSAAPTTQAPTLGGGDWCEGARAIDERSDQIEAETDGFVEQFSRQFRELVPMQLDLARHAPDEIADDVDLFTTGMQQVIEVLERYDYNILNIPEEEIATLDDPAFNQASDNIQAYNEANCGITDDDDELDSDNPLSSADLDAILESDRRDELLGPLTDMGLSEDQAVCALRAVFDSGVNANPTDPAFIAVLTDCGLSVEDLARIGATGSVDGDIDAGSAPELDELINLLPLLQGNPALTQTIVDTLVAIGIDEVAAGCLGDALSSDTAVETYTDAGSLLTLLDDCGVAAEDLAVLAG